MRKRFHGLKRIKLRQSWNKYNLYNLARATEPRFGERTFFQQKWTSKSDTRAYHGEVVREKKWQRMFRGSMRSVVPMDANYLARYDGSEQARGRGSGLEVEERKGVDLRKRIPHENMLFTPIERRLDTAIFRSLFASSTRQARQFVVHGYVTVNGKKMIYPGYQLNPGDMFQVDIERVMYATGAPKDREERREGRVYRKSLKKEKKEEDAAEEEAEAAGVAAAENNAESSPAEAEAEADEAKQAAEQNNLKRKKASLQDLMQQAKSLLTSPNASLTAKRKQDLREFTKTVRRTLSRPNSLPIEDLNAKLDEISSRLQTPTPQSSTSTSASTAEDMPKLSTPALQAEADQLTPSQLHTLRTALLEARENPVDPSKPYATPWRPRDYMSAFAFIPRYLEVNHKICSAVYVRHPVARPGIAEIPTPFTDEVMGLTRMWYLRRR